MKTSRIAGLFVTAAISLGLVGSARAEQRSWSRVTTGNGHGYAVFDADSNKITTFLEHPYRYLRPEPNNPTGEGVARRNLAFDMFFGIKGKVWLSTPDASEAPEFLDQSNILHAPATIGGAKADSYFFEPFGLERNVMIGLLHAEGQTDGAALFNFHMGSGNPDPGANGESTTLSTNTGVKAIIEKGPGGGSMVYVALSATSHLDCGGVFNKINGGLGDAVAQSHDDIACGMQGSLADGWMGVAVGYTDGDAETLVNDIKTWAAARTPSKILDDTKAEFEAWRKPIPEGTALCSDDEKKLWRQSETVLRMGQVREPNIPGRSNNGMILASLPIGQWHTGWVRDAQYALSALIRTGHFAEAKMGLDFFMNAQPIGKYKTDLKTPVDYRISVVRYFGTGEEQSDFNEDGPNIELDGWGMFLWSARQYVELSGDAAWLNSSTFNGSVYSALKNGVANAIEANLESNGIVSADSGPWEVHKNKNRHYAYTTIAAARGLCDMAMIASKGSQSGDIAKYQGLSKKVKDAFLATFVDPQGALAGSTEGLQSGKYQDGAVAEAFDWNILDDWKGDTANATLDVFEKLRVQSGGYKRNNDGLSSYDNNEWILVDLRIADAYRRAGRGAVADGIVATVVQKAANNFYILPELYNDTASAGQIGRYAGEIPMVGFGAGAYMITMLDRSGLIEPNDCADGKGKKASFPEGVLPSEDGTIEEAGSSRSLFRAAPRPQMGENGSMKLAFRDGAVSFLLAAAVACGGKPAELVKATGKPELLVPPDDFPKIRFGDGLVSANDRCPVTKRKLSKAFPPVYVNGRPIGFC